MEELMDLWAALRQRISVLIEQLREIPVGQKFDALIAWLREIPIDLALTIAAVACVVAFLLLISRLRARRAYRRVRAERDDLKQELAAVRADYDSEVRWRMAFDRYEASKAADTKSPARS